MTDQEIYRKIVKIDWEGIQKDLPKNKSILINGYKIPPEEKNEKQMFWKWLMTIEYLDKLEYIQSPHYPNYKYEDKC